MWKERLETYRSAAGAAGRPNLVKFLDYLMSTKPEWLGGTTGLKNHAKSGSIAYTERAFHQDATEAMRGDIVRGLI